MSSTLLEARAIITGEDRTGPAFDAVERRLKALAATSEAVGRVSGVVNQVSSALNGQVAALQRASGAVDKYSRAMQSIGLTARVGWGLAAVPAALGAKRVARNVFHTYREFDIERRWGKAVMGLTDDQQKPLVQQALHLGATTRFNDIQVLEAQRELAARGVKLDAILGMIPAAADMAAASGQTLPEAVKQLEGAIFGFKKHVDSVDAAAKAARETADIQTRLAKSTGMTPEDIRQAYKYAATPARLAGVSETRMLAFAGVLKRANIGGDEAGTAFRALMATIQSPTAGAKIALRAAGMPYDTYRKAPDRLDVDRFASAVADTYGVRLTEAARKRLGQVFGDKRTISDSQLFAPAVLQVLGDALGKKDARSKRSIAGLANRFRDASMKGVDADRMITDLLVQMRDNLRFANALFGAKQGGRIATALSDPTFFAELERVLREGSEGYAKKVADTRMEGFDGAVSRFEGATKNLWSRFGQANDHWMTPSLDRVGRFVQSLAELDDKSLQAATAIGGFVTAIGLAKTALMALNVARTLQGKPPVELPPMVPTRLPSFLTAPAGVAGSAFGGVMLAGQLLEMGKPTSPEGWNYRYDLWDGNAPGILERSRRAAEDYRRDPEAARGRAFARLDLSAIRAEVTGPVSAELKGQADINVTVKVEAGSTLIQATEAARSASATGPLKANLGVSMPEASAGSGRFGRN